MGRQLVVGKDGILVDRSGLEDVADAAQLGPVHHKDLECKEASCVEWQLNLLRCSVEKDIGLDNLLCQHACTAQHGPATVQEL